MTCVLIRSEHCSKLSQPMIGFAAVGRFGVLGNKGAVAVRFRLQIGSHRFKTFCFVGSHLSAHQKEVVKRNADYSHIFRSLRFANLDIANSKEYLTKSMVSVETFLGLKRTSQGSGHSGNSAELYDDHESEAPVLHLSHSHLLQSGASGFSSEGGNDAHTECSFQEMDTTYSKSMEVYDESMTHEDQNGDLESIEADSSLRGVNRGDSVLTSPLSAGPRTLSILKPKSQLARAGRSISRISMSLSKRTGTILSGVSSSVVIGGSPTSAASASKSSAEEDFANQADLLALSYGRIGDEPIKIQDHDLVFWFGDLNYRIDSFSWRETIELIRQKNLSLLMEHDQLITERAHERVFHKFHEGVINFVPTYKFEPGTNHYDTRGPKDNGKRVPRTPSWCDRVLWRVSEASGHNLIQQCSYFSCPEYKISDHKPVGAEFILPFVELSILKRPGLVTAASMIVGDRWSHRSNQRGRQSRHSDPDRQLPLSQQLSLQDFPSDLHSGEEDVERSHHSDVQDEDSQFVHERSQSDGADGHNSHVDDEEEHDENYHGAMSRSSSEHSMLAENLDDEADIANLSDAAALRNSGGLNFESEERESLNGDWYSDEDDQRSHYTGYTGYTTESRAVRTVIATRDVKARSSEEISFQAGDLLELFMEEKLRIDDGWLLGRRLSDGAIGYFPASSVNALGAMSEKRQSGRGKTLKSLRKATALRFDRKKTERLMRLHEIEEDIEAHERELNRRQRFLNILRKALVGTASKMYEHERTKSMRFFDDVYDDMVAIGDYEAEDSDELSFEKGQQVEVVSFCFQEDDEDGWFMARIGEDEGLVPRRFFEPIEVNSPL
eukprot:CAMPEP_0171567424 /NCGR_PEP_ID=MMETSP0961-20121227/1149_1 /TAXON_ID=87120 /ORGANISM="Aurantiochytrium limacinum, Strain ATCCMYA-1381" /LENGTH=836 /DNA_ID=CAMNT_0012121337 /DNA_START=519 /DNA_END=3029 /DNA_ORIENTATION=+